MRVESDPPTRSADVSRLPTRQRVLILLREPRCAREIRERLPGTHRKQIETALHRLAQDRLAECVTPGVLQSRLYRRTYIGDLLVDELIGEPPRPWTVMHDDELRTRAYIQAGRYRRLVLRVVGNEDDPRTARELRKSVLPVYSRIGMGHVHQALRELMHRGVAVRDEHGRWSLTELGEKLQAIELDGLPKRPTVIRPLWERIEPAQQEHQQGDPDGEQEHAGD